MSDILQALTEAYKNPPSEEEKEKELPSPSTTEQKGTLNREAVDFWVDQLILRSIRLSLVQDKVNETKKSMDVVYEAVLCSRDVEIIFEEVHEALESAEALIMEADGEITRAIKRLKTLSEIV